MVVVPSARQLILRLEWSFVQLCFPLLVQLSSGVELTLHDKPRHSVGFLGFDFVFAVTVYVATQHQPHVQDHLRGCLEALFLPLHFFYPYIWMTQKPELLHQLILRIIRQCFLQYGSRIVTVRTCIIAGFAQVRNTIEIFFSLALSYRIKS